MASDDFMLLQSFHLTLSDIAEVEVDKLHAFSVGVRWPHRPDDWELVLKMGWGVAALDEIGRVSATAMCFPLSDGFATVGMVITMPRLQANGAGSWLMKHLLARVEAKTIGLNATRAAYQLYLHLGFTPERKVFQCQGLAHAVTPPALASGLSVQAAAPADLDELIALDRAAYGIDRTALLTYLLARSAGRVLRRDGRIAAFALCRRFGRGRVVGPVVAASDEDAVAVTAPLIAERAGTFLRLDTHHDGGAFARFLTEAGLGVFDTVTTMSLNGPWLKPAAAGEPRIYGLVNQALG